MISPSPAREQWGMLPLAGDLTARLLEAAPLSIHGDQYLDLTISPEPPTRPEAPTRPGPASAATLRVRAPLHALPGGQIPARGCRVRISFLMQQVTGIALLPEPDAPAQS